jgi:iron complex outermembrane receptor protein
LQAYLSYAQANKEPNRNDFEAAINEQPKKETLHDFEAGISKRTVKYNIGATAYYMLYKDQLVLTGKINNVGSYTRVNVPSSFRLGVELQGSYIFNRWVNANANLSLSRNKIKDFTEYIDDYDNGTQLPVRHHNTDISFSPPIVAGSAINIIPLKNLEVSLLSKYAGRQYLDNTQMKNRSLDGYFVQDVRAGLIINKWIFTEWNISGQLNNIFNKKYEPNGYTFSYIYGNSFTTENYYYPMAGTNFMLAVNIKL